MNIFWLLGVSLLPLFPLLLMVIQISNFQKVYRKRVIREVPIVYSNIKSFFPRNIGKCLDNDKKVAPKDSKNFILAYRKIFRSVCFYGLFWILYLAYIGYRIYLICIGRYAMLEPKNQGAIIGSVVMSILISYWLLFVPIFEYFKLTKWAHLGYIIWDIIQKFIDKTTSLAELCFKYFFEIAISYAMLYYYIIGVKLCLYYLEISASLWVMLALLIIYQYIILRLISFLLYQLFRRIKFSELKKYKKNIILKIVRNCTYLCMVIIYAYSVYKNVDSTPLPAATGILFLIDTFLEKNSEINNILKSDNQKYNPETKD